MANIPEFYANNAEFDVLRQLCEMAGFPVLFEKENFDNCLAYCKDAAIHFPVKSENISRFDNMEHATIVLGHELSHNLDICVSDISNRYNCETDRTGYERNEALVTVVGTYFALLARSIVHMGKRVDVDALTRDLQESSRKASEAVAAHRQAEKQVNK